jgi:hypothetical protein
MQALFSPAREIASPAGTMFFISAGLSHELPIAQSLFSLLRQTSSDLAC